MRGAIIKIPRHPPPPPPLLYSNFNPVRVSLKPSPIIPAVFANYKIIPLVNQMTRRKTSAAAAAVAGDFIGAKIRT